MILAALLPGCEWIFPRWFGPKQRIPDATIQERERCDSQPVDARLYSADLVEKAEPFFRYVPGGTNGRDAHLGGATLRVRPLPGVTVELLERSLLCRSARLMLGHAAPAPDEPYWLPDGWVKIGVTSNDGAFVVTLEGEDPEHAKMIFARATAFAKHR